MNTYVFTPASLAALAFSMHKSWSIFHWFWIPPAVAFVVPTALKTTDGLGDREDIMPPHFETSPSSRAWSLGDWAFGSLLETVLTDENASMARSVARIWEPTAPVQPNTAAVVMVKDPYLLTLSISNGTPTSKKRSETMEMWGSGFWDKRGHIVDCETCVVFFEFAESLTKFSDKCKIRTRFVESTPLPPRCFICSILSASYVAYPVLHMRPIQCSICDLLSAPYVVYPVPHMWPTQCFICSISSAPYVTYLVLHI